MDWTEQICNDKMLYNKKFCDLKKIVTITWTISNRRNNVMFRNHTCILDYVLDSVIRTFLFTIQYNIVTNKFLLNITIGQHKGYRININITRKWIPPP